MTTDQQLRIQQARAIVIALNQAMYDHATASAPGIVNVTIDGTTTSYSVAAAQAELLFWERRLRALTGRRKTIIGVDMSRYND